MPLDPGSIPGSSTSEGPQRCGPSSLGHLCLIPRQVVLITDTVPSPKMRSTAVGPLKSSTARTMRGHRVVDT